MSKPGVRFDIPKDGRKQLSKHRNVELPLHTFEEDSSANNSSANYVLTTPIGKALRGSSRRTTDESAESKPEKSVTFIIFLTRLRREHGSPNLDHGIQFVFESGTKANCVTLLENLAKVYEIPSDIFRELFSVWLISPLLEVQLKPYHRPYEVRQGWQILLKRFGDKTTPTRNQHDDPVLMFRRCVNLLSEREFEILEKYPQAAPILVADVRERILFDCLHFPCVEDVVKITALLFCHQHGEFDEKKHDVAFIRANIEDILPERLCDLIVGATIFGKSLSKKTVREEKLLAYWKESIKYGNENERRIELLKTLSQSSSCYGSAWFTAVMEKKTSRVSSKIFGQSFAPTRVNVGINDRWLTIIDADTKEALVVQAIEEMTWKLEFKKKDDEPYLLFNLSPDDLTISPTEENPASETVYFLQIFGKQTILIDALLSSILSLNLSRAHSNSASSSDSTTSSEKHATVVRRLQTKNCTTLNDKKLCLAKYENGKCTELTGSFKYTHSQAQTIS